MKREEKMKKLLKMLSVLTVYVLAMSCLYCYGEGKADHHILTNPDWP